MSQDINGIFSFEPDFNLQAEYVLMAAIARATNDENSNDAFSCLLSHEAAGQYYARELYDTIEPNPRLGCLDIGTDSTLTGMPKMSELFTRTVANISMLTINQSSEALIETHYGADGNLTLYGGKQQCTGTGGANETVGDGIINAYDLAVLLWTRFRADPYDSVWSSKADLKDVATVVPREDTRHLCCADYVSAEGWACYEPNDAVTRPQYIVSLSLGYCEPASHPTGRRLLEYLQAPDDSSAAALERAVTDADGTLSPRALQAVAAAGGATANSVFAQRWAAIPGYGTWHRIELPTTVLAAELFLANLPVELAAPDLAVKAPPEQGCTTYGPETTGADSIPDCRPHPSVADQIVFGFRRRLDILAAAGLEETDCAMIFPGGDGVFFDNGGILSVQQRPPARACPFDLFVWVPEAITLSGSVCDGSFGVLMGSSFNDGEGGFAQVLDVCSVDFSSPPPPPGPPAVPQPKQPPSPMPSPPAVPVASPPPRPSAPEGMPLPPPTMVAQLASPPPPSPNPPPPSPPRPPRDVQAATAAAEVMYDISFPSGMPGSFAEQKAIIDELVALYAQAGAVSGARTVAVQPVRHIVTTFGMSAPESVQSELTWFAEALRAVLSLDASATFNVAFSTAAASAAAASGGSAGRLRSRRRRLETAGSMQVGARVPTGDDASFAIAAQAEDSLRSMRTCTLTEEASSCGELASLESSLLSGVLVSDVAEPVSNAEVAIVLALEADTDAELDDAVAELQRVAPSAGAIAESLRSVTEMDVSSSITSTVVSVFPPPSAPPPSAPSLLDESLVNQVQSLDMLLHEHPIVAAAIVGIALIIAGVVVLMAYCVVLYRRRLSEATRKEEAKTQPPTFDHATPAPRRRATLLRQDSLDGSPPTTPASHRARGAAHGSRSLARRSSAESYDSATDAEGYDSATDASKSAGVMRAPQSLRQTWPSESYHGFMFYAAKARLALRRREPPPPPSPAKASKAADYEFDDGMWDGRD